MVFVVTTTTFFSAKVFAWLAASMILLLFGKIKTVSAFTLFTLFNISSVLGFMVCPPSIISLAPKSLNMSDIPSPIATAIAPYLSTGFGASSAVSSAALYSFSSNSSSLCCSLILSILILESSPYVRANSSTLPGLLVWICTFMRFSSPAITSESPNSEISSLHFSSSTCFPFIKNSVQ